MPLVKIKYKRNIRLPIRPGQKEYLFLCPFRDIQIGEYFLVENKGGANISLGRVEEIVEDNPLTVNVSGVCFSRIDCKDVDDRAANCMNIWYAYLHRKKIYTENKLKKKRSYYNNPEAQPNVPKVQVAILHDQSPKKDNDDSKNK
ncbi:hypothetical protein [Tannockella kyphosi]|uniref:hypothetical protein n=1 Tax=Tannockella kyphosi TaxID=2899121 RepID=UPI0020115E17|nr:hypothetical protein [Tannockella kyphosi]